MAWGFGNVQRPTGANPFAPQRGTGSITNPYPNAPVGGGGGGRTNRLATEGATAYKKAMGLPDFQDLLSGLGGGSKEFGNSGLAASGAADMKAKLAAQEANLNRVRGDIRNPTGTEGFKSVMRLTNEELGNATENDRRHAAEAASRRGYVGGYSPDQAAQTTREQLALAGGKAAAGEREAQQNLFTGESSLYGNQLSSYTDLTKTAAELPSKWFNSISGLLGGISGGFGDIFHTSSGNVQFDTGNERQDTGRQRQDLLDRQNRMRGTPGMGGMVGG